VFFEGVEGCFRGVEASSDVFEGVEGCFRGVEGCF